MNIEETLKKAYLQNGGTETGFEQNKGELIKQFRNQAAVNAAIEEARKPVNINDALRMMRDDQPAQHDLLGRIVTTGDDAA